MPDPISTAATSYNLAATLAKHGRAFWRWVHQHPPEDGAYRIPHTGFELVPESFRVLLNAQIPELAVMFRGINYTRKPIEITAASVYQLLLPNGPSLDNVTLSGQYSLAAQSSSTMITLRRGLVEAEVRAVRRQSIADTADASVGYSARARSGNKEYRYDPPGGHLIRGLIAGRDVGGPVAPKQQLEPAAAETVVITEPSKLIVADLSLPAEQAERVEQLLQSERTNAVLWEYRYLNYYLANGTQLLLNHFMTLTQPVSLGLLDNQLQVFVPDANERNAMVGALLNHHLIQINSGFIEVTPKGASYANWDGRKKPTVPPGVVVPTNALNPSRSDS